MGASRHEVAHKTREFNQLDTARGGIEPPTRGFSVRRETIDYHNNQSLAALASLHSATSRHSLGALNLDFGTGLLGSGFFEANVPCPDGRHGFSATTFPFFHT